MGRGFFFEGRVFWGGDFFLRESFFGQGRGFFFEGRVFWGGDFFLKGEFLGRGFFFEGRVFLGRGRRVFLDKGVFLDRDRIDNKLFYINYRIINYNIV